MKTQGRSDIMGIQDYPIPCPESLGGGFENRCWTPVNAPVLGDDGRVAYIVHRVEDVTEAVQEQGQVTSATGGASVALLPELEIDAKDADASGFEPVWQGDRRVGFITSGGYGHTIGKSLAMALVDQDAVKADSELSTHIVGEERPARVISPSPHDPEGNRMRH